MDNLDTFGKRLKWCRDRLNLSQKEFSELCGWEGAARISNYEKDMREPNQNDINTIAKVSDVDPGWLLFGTGIFPEELYNLQPTRFCKQIPLISWSQAVDFHVKKYDFSLDTYQEKLPMAAKASDKSYYLDVKGDAMISPYAGPTYSPGDRVMVDPEATPMDQKIVVAFKEGSNEGMLRKYVIDGGKEYLHALNPAYPAIPVDETIQICGVVVCKITF